MRRSVWSTGILAFFGRGISISGIIRIVIYIIAGPKYGKKRSVISFVVA